MSAWTLIPHTGNGRYRVVNEALNLSLENCIPEIISQGRALSPGEDWNIKTGDDSVEYTLDGQWKISLSWKQDKEALLLNSCWENLSGSPVALDWVNPLTGAAVVSPSLMDRVLTNGKDMVGFSSMYAGPGRYDSFSVLGMTDARGTCALTAGFTALDTAFYTFAVDVDDESGKGLECRCDREGILLEAGAVLEISPLRLEAGASLSSLMKAYAVSVADLLGRRDPGQVPSGWCSWYYYYDTLTEEDLYANMDAIEQSDNLDVDFIQIDDGWNLESKTSSRVWGDWQAGGLFPGGMKKAADDIKARGFKPGLWLAPFSVDKASIFYKEHGDLLVQDEEKGGPKDFWGTYGLDLSHPGALDFLRETFTRVFDEWGFQYIKIDFLLHAVLPGNRYDNSKTTAEIFRQGIQVIRDVAKDRYILGCGSPMGPAVGVFDGMRIGYDVSSRWFIPDGGPLGNCNIKAPAVQHTWRYWMHQNWWQNDPDCLLVRDYAPEPEFENFRRHFPDYVDSPAYGLTDNEASCWAQMVWMTGGLAMIGENMVELKGERLELLKSSLPVHKGKVRWFDSYDHPHRPVFVTEEGSLMIGIFNLSDDTADFLLDGSSLGLNGEWTFRERLSSETLSGKGSQLNFEAVPARTGKIWILQSSKG
ncbi:MAG: alpha-galactosidase [Spirochaetales bacterium]|nr:alpha-galactosidase [Spirochaetales bacterium]